MVSKAFAAGQAALVFLGAVGSSNAVSGPYANVTVPYRNITVSLAAPDPPKALPMRATANDRRWQPAMDFDTDGCYNVPAIDAEGNISQGLEHNWVSASQDCHDASDLENNNVYSRQRCNSGWCVYIYDYYFEKDVAVQNFIDVGHTHDWEVSCAANTCKSRERQD